MSIYELDNEGFRDALMRFGKTWYGKSVFLLAYFVPFVLFVSALIMMLVCVVLPQMDYLLNCSLVALVGFVPCFMVANIYYYNEIRKFLEHEKKNKKS